MSFSPEQLQKRRLSIGGSDANIIMSGDPAAILALWQVKVGQAAPEDLSRVLPVQMGVWTEPLNRRWYTMLSGNEVCDVGKEVRHSSLDFMTCTLDGAVPAESAIFEAKHVNAFSNVDETAQKYMGQLHQNMACCNVSRAVLSVFVGTLKYEYFIVKADPFYTATLIENVSAFWAHVKSGTPPGDLPSITNPLTGPVKMRSVDMKGSNAWAAHASTWRASKDIAKKFETASKELKALIEPDVGEAFGSGIICSRAKNGNLTIKELKQ